MTSAPSRSRALGGHGITGFRSRVTLVLALGVALFTAALLALGQQPGTARPPRRDAMPTANQRSGVGGTRTGSRRRRPLLAVVGASVSAGVGTHGIGGAWESDLARQLRWRLVVSADPGAGYVNRGKRARGPFYRLAARLDLARTRPGLVIIQGGHDDIGEPVGALRTSVVGLITTIHHECPHARLGLLTVFTTGDRPSASARTTDRTIVSAARAADAGVMVFDPLMERWRFPRVRDRLHPTSAGDRWIADEVANELRRACVPHTGHGPRPVKSVGPVKVA